MAENTGWGSGGNTPADEPHTASSTASTKAVQVTITTGNTTGQAAHGMSGTPKVGRPNPDKLDGLNGYASADATNVTVTTDAPVSSNVVFTVIAVL